jgi:hypothetical protein
VIGDWDTLGGGRQKLQGHYFRELVYSHRKMPSFFGT